MARGSRGQREQQEQRRDDSGYNSTHDELDIQTGLRLLAEARKTRIERAREDVNTFIELVAKDTSKQSQEPQPVVQRPVHLQMQADIDRYRRYIIMSHPSSGKALDVKTPIPCLVPDPSCPTGWKLVWATMGDLLPGDTVIDRWGRPCRVVSKSHVYHDHAVYRVEFDDGAYLDADADHQWWAFSPESDQLSVVKTSDFLDGMGWAIPRVVVSSILSDPGLSNRSNLPLSDGGLETARRVVSVTRVPTVPVQCITVNSSDNSYLAGSDFVVTHNTTQVIMRAIWEIGRNPNIRIVIASKQKTVKAGTGYEIFNAIRSLVDDPLVREVFPNMARGPTWTADTFTVKRSIVDKNPTCKMGAANDYMKGARIDLLILDDWYDERSCESPTERKRLQKWIFAIQDRLSPEGRIVACCNAIHPDDPAHHIEKLALSNPDKFAWKVRRFPVYEPADYDIDLSKVRLISPHIFNRRKIEEERNNNPQLTFQRLYLCNAIDEAGSVFDHTSVNRAFRSPDEPEGEGVDPFPELRLKDQLQLGVQVVIGIDLAASEKPSADKTCLTAVAYWPNEDVRQVLWIESGRWRSDVVAQKIVEWDRRFRPASIVVETSGQQNLMMGTIRLQVENEGLRRGQQIPMPPIRGFYTNAANKWHQLSGVESLSTEIIAGRWRFPAIIDGVTTEIQSELQELKTAMINYVRGQHTGDHLMSLWLANQGIRMIAYDEDDSRAESEIDRAIDRVEDLVYRYRPSGIDHEAEILSAEDALVAWERLRVEGVDLTPYSDDYTALITAWSDSEPDTGDDNDPFDIPDPEDYYQDDW